MNWDNGLAEMIAVIALVIGNAIGAIGLWTRINLVLKGLEFRVALLEKNQEEYRGDIKGLTAELHHLCVAIAKKTQEDV